MLIATMVCRPFDPVKKYEEDCQDVAMVFKGTDDQVHVHTRFGYRSRIVAESVPIAPSCLTSTGRSRCCAAARTG